MAAAARVDMAARAAMAARAVTVAARLVVSVPWSSDMRSRLAERDALIVGYGAQPGYGGGGQAGYGGQGGAFCSSVSPDWIILTDTFRRLCWWTEWLRRSGWWPGRRLRWRPVWLRWPARLLSNSLLSAQPAGSKSVLLVSISSHPQSVRNINRSIVLVLSLVSFMLPDCVSKSEPSSVPRCFLLEKYITACHPSSSSHPGSFLSIHRCLPHSFRVCSVRMNRVSLVCSCSPRVRARAHIRSRLIMHSCVGAFVVCVDCRPQAFVRPPSACTTRVSFRRSPRSLLPALSHPTSRQGRCSRIRTRDRVSSPKSVCIDRCCAQTSFHVPDYPEIAANARAGMSVGTAVAYPGHWTLAGGI